MADLTDHDLREHVRARYSDAALRMADRDATAGCGCGCETSDSADACCTDAATEGVFGADLYDSEQASGAPAQAVSASLGCGVPTAVADLHEGETVLDLGSGAGADVLISAQRVGTSGRAIGLDMTDEMLELARTNAAQAGAAPETAVNASLGCGVPTAVADLHEGETVLDLGSGAGADVLISARRVGATGKAIGLDMTDEMLELARGNAAAAGVENVEFVKGYIEEIPLPDASVDVVISNCVINLAGDKSKVLAEAARVLRPGGRFAVSDVIADPGMDDATRADMAAYTGCIAGALTEQEFRAGLTAAGLTDIEVRLTHRVHPHASSAIIRARKPPLA